MAASFAFGGLAGQARAQAGSEDQIVPYVRQPTGLTPTEPLSYASATLLDGIANGVLVTTIDGRPIKIEGNPDHPWSRGGTDLFGQASVLGLYDPDRSQAVQHLGGVSDWDSFRTALASPVRGAARDPWERPAPADRAGDVADADRADRTDEDRAAGVALARSHAGRA